MTDKIYVNSADSISLSRVDDLFGGAADSHGAIARSWLDREYGPNAILGKVEIRKTFQQLYKQETGSPKPVSNERARQLLEGYQQDEFHEVAITMQNSLEAWAKDKATLRTQGIETRTSGPTNPSSGTTPKR